MLGVASRFSVLKIEGEENPRNPNKKKAEKIKQDKKQSTQNGKAGPPKKKTGGSSQNGQAAGSKSKSKASKAKSATSAQWEEWKRKDEEYVDINYEGELEEAILQSKLDFEQNKGLYERIRKESEMESKLAAGGKKKKKAMTLEEFNNMPDGSINGAEECSSPSDRNDIAAEDPEFFDRIKQEAKDALKGEQTKPCRTLEERKDLKARFDPETLNYISYQVKCEEKDKEIASLKDELSQVKEDLSKLKSRYKKLCFIFGQAEVRDKAEILVELDKLQHVKDELTEEVSSLHAQLEQERSKVHSLTSSDGKGKGGKKRTASENHN